MKVFRLFRLEWIFLGVERESVDTVVGRCTTSSYLLAGPAYVCDALFFIKEQKRMTLLAFP